MSPQVVIRFGDFELDPEQYQLRRAGQIQKLEKIPMELLLLLASRPGILVSRSEITGKLWEPGVFIESERGINTAIGKIRRVLEDDPDQPRYLQTVVGKGYRFIADIKAGESIDVALPLPSLKHVPPVSLMSEPEEPGAGANAKSRSAVPAMVLAATAFVIALAAVYHTDLRDWLSQLFSPKIRSIAVLPMVNLAHDPNEEYFVDGMTDQLITNLAQTTPLRVISRTSIMQLKNIRKSLPEIARLLNVDAVVEGSVMRYGGQLKIEAQLLDARRDRHLWAKTYKSRDDHVLALQDEVTRDIAAHVATTLRPQTGSIRTHNQHTSTESHENYLRGLYYLSKRTPDALRRSAEYFQEAVEIDPGNALAYVGLADTYNVISFYGGPPPSESFPKAEAAAKKALALNSKLGEAHAALGDTLFSYYWDWPGADREFRQAVELDPGNAVTHHWYSELLSILGRHDEAIAEIQKAKELDPLSLVINDTVSGALYLARRYDEAETQIKETLELDDGYGPAHNTLGWIYLCKNKNREAMAEFRKAIALSGDSPSDVAALGYAYGQAGDRNKARQIAAELEARSKDEYVSPEFLARLYAAAGDKDMAVARLEDAYKARVDTLNNIYVEPCYDGLRSDHRFQSLVKRMKFVQ